MRVGRFDSHGWRRATLTPVQRALTRAWPGAASHALVFAALLAITLAPLGMCCPPRQDLNAAALKAAIGPGADVILCAHGQDGGGKVSGAPTDQAPGSSGEDHCPFCPLGAGAALIAAPPASFLPTPPPLIEIAAAPQILAAGADPSFLPGRARAPPHLI